MLQSFDPADMDVGTSVADSSAEADFKRSVGASRLRIAIAQHDHALGHTQADCEFRSWQDRVQPAMLCYRHWVKALLAVTEAKRDDCASDQQQAARRAWTMWLQEGPAAGLGRQHRMSRTAVGWVASATLRDDRQQPDELGEHQHEVQEVRVHQWPARCTWEHHEAPGGTGPAPCSLQQHVDSSASDWANHWSCDLSMPECEWPRDLGSLPPQLEVYLLREVLASFASGLGLGWDAIHPRSLLRLGDATPGYPSPSFPL